MNTVNQAVRHTDIRAFYGILSMPGFRLAYYERRVPAGGSDDLEELLEETLNLNDYLAAKPERVFCIRVSGNSMIGAGIHDNDLLVVDKILEATDGKIVVASINNELTLKRLKYQGDQIWLVPENPAYQPILIGPDMELKILGVVLHVIHSVG